MYLLTIIHRKQVSGYKQLKTELSMKLDAVGEVPIAGSTGKPSTGGGAVAGVVAAGAIARPGRPLRRVRVVGAGAGAVVPVDALALGRVRPGGWASVGVAA